MARRGNPTIFGQKVKNCNKKFLGLNKPLYSLSGLGGKNLRSSVVDPDTDPVGSASYWRTRKHKNSDFPACLKFGLL
jgi:hypothetical protein